MPKYIWTAKNARGETVVREIAANTPNEAQAMLASAGLTDLQLKQDEVMTTVQAGVSGVNFLGQELKITPEDRVKAQDNPTGTLFAVIKQGVLQSKGLVILLVLIATYDVYRGSYISAALFIAGLLAWLIFVIYLGLPSIYYRKVIKASDWARWQEVLSLVEAIKQIGRFSFVKIPQTVLIRLRAKALVGMGRLQEGLTEYQQCQGRPDCPNWLYRLFVAGLYSTAKDHDKAIEYNILSIQEHPTSSAWCDLAYRYARYKRDPEKARAAMAEADKSPMSDVVRPFRLRCLGVIAYLEGDYTTASHELTAAIDLVAKAKGRPFRDGHLSVGRAYLCCVQAKQGDIESAKKNFALAEKYLVATDESELLAECRQAIGDS